jgi:hypothetical protein
MTVLCLNAAVGWCPAYVILSAPDRAKLSLPQQFALARGKAEPRSHYAAR